MLLHRHFEEEVYEPTQPKPRVTQVPLLSDRATARKKRGKAAVYAGTKNLYGGMVTAAKSLMCHSDVNKIYFLIESKEFPYEIPKEIECIDISKQDIFHWSGPNYNSHWTYMVLMRAALTKVFPDYDRILSLDVDTIVEDDISDLWDIDMGDCVIGAVQEYHAKYRPYGPQYWNAGVMLQDLNKLRETGLDDQIIHAINHEKFTYNEQCAINKYCVGRIFDLPTRYNDCYICGMSDNPAIVHYIGTSQWQTDKTLPRYELLEKYRAMSWDDVKRIRKSKYQADRSANRKG